MVLNCIKLITKYYRSYHAQKSIIKRLIKEVFVFVLILFLISYIFYYVSVINHNVAAYKYSNYDAIIEFISSNQALKIKGYDFVEYFITYISVSDLELENITNNSTARTRLINVFRCDDYTDIDKTIFCPRLIKERDTKLLADKSINPIFLKYDIVRSLNAKIGDKIKAKFGDLTIEYTLAAIYENMLIEDGCVILDEPLLNWLFEGQKKSVPYMTKDDVALNSGYIKFKDKKRGIDFLRNFYSDFNLYLRYGEDWQKKATPEELEYYKGKYYLREIDYKINLHNMADDFTRVIVLICFTILSLVIFVIWEQNKIIILTIKSITILIANGCRLIAFCIYFFLITFLKYFVYLYAAILLFKLYFINLLNNGISTPWYLITETLPIMFCLVLISSIIISLYLYQKIKTKTVLFTEEG